MTLYRPDQLRDALSSVVAGLTPLDSYVQNATTDTAWYASHEPFAPDMPIEDLTGLRHMMFYVEIREVSLWSVIGTDTKLRALVDAYCLSAVRPAGDYAPVQSWNEALCMARHMWFALANADKSLTSVTAVTEQGETSYRVIPLTVDWLMGHVRIPILFSDTMEA